MPDQPGLTPYTTTKIEWLALLMNSQLQYESRTQCRTGCCNALYRFRQAGLNRLPMTNSVVLRPIYMVALSLEKWRLEVVRIHRFLSRCRF